MLKVRIKVLRGFNELGVLEGDLDESKLPMHKNDETEPSRCVEILKGHLVQMENHANAGPLRLHLEIVE